MPYEALRLDIHDHVATLTLHRPEAYNALNVQMAGELLDAMTRLERRSGGTLCGHHGSW